MSDPEEEWRPVPGYEGRYEISDQGNLRSTVDGLTRVLKRNVSERWGTASFNLSIEGVAKSFTAARLVCLAWHGPDNGRRARHLTEDPLDDRPQSVGWS